MWVFIKQLHVRMYIPTDLLCVPGDFLQLCFLNIHNLNLTHLCQTFQPVKPPNLEVWNLENVPKWRKYNKNGTSNVQTTYLCLSFVILNTRNLWKLLSTGHTLDSTQGACATGSPWLLDHYDEEAGREEQSSLTFDLQWRVSSVVHGYK